MPDLPADGAGKPSSEMPKEQPPSPQESASTPPAATQTPGPGAGLDWRLVVIVGIAVFFLIALYANRRWYGKQRAELPATQQPVEGASGTESSRPPASPAEGYARMTGAREFEAKGITFTAPGGKVMMLAVPAVPIAGKDNPGQVQDMIPAKVFDVTHRAQGLKPEMLHRRLVCEGNQVLMANMDTFPPLGVDKRLQMDVRAAPEMKADAQVDAQLVVGIKVGTEARAYPVRLMNYHDVINDTLGGAPVVVVWSAWANTASAMYRGDSAEEAGESDSLDDPDAETAIPTFGSAGLIFQSANVLYDTGTYSLWSATERRCIAGERTGAELKPLQAEVMTWHAWKTLNPGTTVVVGTKPPLQVNYNVNPATPPDYLVAGNPFVHYPAYGLDVTTTPMWLKERVFGVTDSDGKAAKAYPVALLKETKGAFEDTIGGHKVTLQFDPETQWLNAKDADGKPLLTEAMLWIAWFGAHPKSEVWQEEKLRKPLMQQTQPGAALEPEKATPASAPAGKPAPAADTGPVSGAR